MLLEKFTSVCAATPDALAVVAGGHRLTYGELQQRADRLAARLRASGIDRGSLVAVYMQRTVEVIVALLAIMKSGGAYTVVEDDGQPAEHYHRLLAINADLVLCEPAQEAPLHQHGIRTVTVDENTIGDVPAAQLPALAADDVAYVLFTSGSTGQPKGVSVSHGNVAHYTAAIAAALGVDAPLRYAHVSTLAADLGNTSLLLSLASGGCLHLIGAQLRKDPAALRDYLIAERIEFIKITPTHWNAIFGSLGEGGMQGLRLRYLVLGGEALTVAFARRILQSGIVDVLANHYGPTETTVGVTTYPLRSQQQLDELQSECVPIGRPLGDTVLCVRDERGTYALRGCSGELHIGGPSVALGYRNDAETTDKAFTRIDQMNVGGRFYKTGDYVSIDESGVVLFLGRVDRQVKVNGYRVELEHIENVLRSLPEVAEGAVYYIDALGKRRLVAAVQLHGDATADALRRQLEALLPDYMVPKVIVPMPALPRNANGKVDMKALQAELVRQLQYIADERTASANDKGSHGLVEEIRGMWRQYLHGVAFDDDESFFDAGGDSLDAIQLIAELQLKGHQVTAHAFLNEPTVHGLVRAIGASAAQVRVQPKKIVAEFSRDFSAAQDFFLRSRMEQADHYNQALLLECGHKVDIALMNKAIGHLLSGHPSLRIAYGHDAQGAFAKAVAEAMDDTLEVTFISRETDDAAVRHRIETVSQSVQRSLSLADGRLFRARLFKFDHKPDQLLLVAHHIAIDVISWRILVSELSKLYGDYSSGHATGLPENEHTFLDWVAHLDRHQAQLYANAANWLPAALDNAETEFVAIDPGNTEGNAQTWWLGFSAEETEALNHELAARTGVHLHIALLALFSHALARRRGLPQVAVDVESHGRVTFGDDIDVSRVVGWHTSTYPVFIEVDGTVDGTIVATAAAHQQVTDLGAAYGVRKKNTAVATAATHTSAALCYNYLGNINFSHDERLALTPSSYSIGRARGERNHRGHELKLSARIIDDRLLVDLSFADAADVEAMVDVLAEVRSEMLQMVGLEPRASETRLVLEAGTRTGLISYVPPELLALESRDRDYRHVLLTGATGYVGVHVLRELLSRSRAHVHCLVRARPGASTAERLHDVYRHYFGEHSLGELGDRVSVLDGDVSQASFGLPPAQHERLAAQVDAIYHFAADTRLFGREQDFQRNNVYSVEQCMAFCRQSRAKQLHYMSTLAVGGVNAGGEPVEFSERSMDVGQEFQNHYEASKFAAERLVQDFRASGGSGFIYRSGNVSGHSRSGRFQKNARDNRFVQFLTACVKSGQLPQHLGEPIVLSPIDEVAAGIVALSLDTAQDGGTFHVDSDQAVPIEDVFAALERLGIEFEDSDHATFAGLFSALCEAREGAGQVRDPDLALGFFWATRKPRNIRYDNRQTLERMARLGCTFSRLDIAWVDRFVEALAGAGVFGKSSPDADMRSSVSPQPRQQLAVG